MAQGTCNVPGCGTTGRVILGMCSGHYERQRKTGDVGSPVIRPARVKIPDGALCSLGCGRPMHCRTWCQPHYSRWQKTGDVRADIPIHVPLPKQPKIPKQRPIRLCEADDCGEKHYIGGYCIRHNYRVARYGDPDGGSWTFSELVRVTRTLPPDERLWARVDYDGPTPSTRQDLGPCWIWLASLNTSGYGQTFGHTHISQLAHRVAWVLSGNELIPGLELDHLCRTPACLRPSHLEQVEKRINIMRGNGYSARNARKTHCPRGHRYDAANTDRTKQGHRRCRACTNGTFRYHDLYRGMDRQDRALSAAYRQAIVGDACRYCGGPAVEVDHFFPVSKGGTDLWWNLGMSCGWCNRSKGVRCGTAFTLRQRTVEQQLIAA